MSGMWLLGLGASLGYLHFKKQSVEGRLDAAVREYRKDEVASEPAPPNGANMSEIRKAWAYTKDTEHRDFNERLPTRDREEVLTAKHQMQREAEEYDISQGPEVAKIVGVWLDGIPS